MSKKNKTYNEGVSNTYEAPKTLDDHPFYGFVLDEEQKIFRDMIWDSEKKIIFVNSKAGTGKTLIAVATAMLLCQYKRFEEVVYAVSPYGESVQGFLPGTLSEKSSVYFDPLYQAIIKCGAVPEAVIKDESMLSRKYGGAYITPLTHVFLRGDTFNNSVVILDECQNYDIDSLKKTLTRIADDCKVIVIGHDKQCDLGDKGKSGFTAYLKWFDEQKDPRVGICTLKNNHRGWISETADNIPFGYK